MSVGYLREFYGVPARIGGRVRFLYQGRTAQIQSCTHHLNVRFEDNGQEAALHPTWEVQYLDAEGRVIWPVEAS